MSMIYVWPASPGILIRNPATGGYIPPGGAEVPKTREIERALHTGDLLDHDPGSAPENIGFPPGNAVQGLLVDDLESMVGLFPHQVITCVGSEEPGDGGEGLFFWSPTSNVPEDGESVIQAGTRPGRWHRISSAGSSPPQEEGPSLQVIATDASTSPTTTRITFTGTQNAVAIYTGEQPVDEAVLSVYVRINGAAPMQLLLLRWQGRILKVPGASPGDQLAFGTADGRELAVAVLETPEEHPVTTGITQSLATDRAGPPLWTTPQATRLTLPSHSLGFRLDADGTERWVFVKESMDGITWTPTRFVFLPSTGHVNVFTTFSRVALATYEGATLTVRAPAGTTFNGAQSTMHLPFTVTGTTRSVTAGNASDFLAKCALAVSGDEIVLPAGTYTLSANLTHSAFTANGNSPHGIRIRGATGDAEDVVIAGGYSLLIDCASNLAAPMLQDLTIDQTTSSTGVTLTGGAWQLENVTVLPPSSSDDSFNVLSASGKVLTMTCLRCAFPGSPGDVINGAGQNFGGYARFIDCTASEAGPGNATYQVLTTHTGLRFEVYGGAYSDAHTNVCANDNNSKTFLFFTKIDPGARKAGCQHASLFGCDWTGASGDFVTLTFYADSYATLNKFVPLGTGRALVLDEHLCLANRFIGANTSSPNRALDLRRGSSGSYQFVGNILSGLNEAVRTGFYSAGLNAPETPARFYYGLIRNNVVGWNHAAAGGTAVYVQARGCITDTSNTTPINLASDGMPYLSTDYNIWHKSPGSLDADLTPGAHDLIAASQYDGTSLLPTQGGNLDRTGPGGLVPWVGGTDAFGWPLIYTTANSSLGARTYPSVLADEYLFPEFW